jgi:hypothetical protein
MISSHHSLPPLRATAPVMFSGVVSPVAFKAYNGVNVVSALWFSRLAAFGDDSHAAAFAIGVPS